MEIQTEETKTCVNLKKKRQIVMHFLLKFVTLIIIYVVIICSLL